MLKTIVTPAAALLLAKSALKMEQSGRLAYTLGRSCFGICVLFTYKLHV